MMRQLSVFKLAIEIFDLFIIDWKFGNMYTVHTECYQENTIVYYAPG